MRTLAYGLLASTLLACDTEPTKQQSPDAPIEDVVEDTDVTPGQGKGEGEVDPGEGEGEGEIPAFMGSDVLAINYRAFVFNFELVEHDGTPEIYMYKFNKELSTTAMTVLETGLGPDDLGYYVADDYTTSLIQINLEADV